MKLTTQELNDLLFKAVEQHKKDFRSKELYEAEIQQLKEENSCLRQALATIPPTDVENPS